MAEDKVAVFTRNTKNVRWVLTATVGGLLISLSSVQFLAQHTITALQESATVNTGKQTTSESERHQAQADAARHVRTEASSLPELIRSEYRNILETVPSGTSSQEILEILTDRMYKRRNIDIRRLSSGEEAQIIQDSVYIWLESDQAAEIRAQVNAGRQTSGSSKDNDSIPDPNARSSAQRHIDISSDVLAPFSLGVLATLSMALIKTAFHATILIIRERRESTAEP